MFVLTVISTLVTLSFGVVFAFFLNRDDYMGKIVKKTIEESILTEPFKAEIKSFYFNKYNYKSSGYVIAFGIIWLLMTIANSYHIFSFADASVYADVFFTINITLMSISLSTIIIDPIAKGILYSLEEPNLDSLIKGYFNEKYPDFSYLFVPLYTSLASPSKRAELRVDSEPNVFTYKLSPFGSTILKFTRLFEKSIKDASFEKVFKAEILRDESVSILAKLLVLINDPLLKEQLVLNNLDSAKEFNTSFTKMVDELEENITTMQKIDSQLKASEKEIAAYKQAKDVQEKLDFIIKQNFN